MKDKTFELCLLGLLLTLFFLLGLYFGWFFFSEPNLCWTVDKSYDLYGIGGI